MPSIFQQIRNLFSGSVPTEESPPAAASQPKFLSDSNKFLDKMAKVVSSHPSASAGRLQIIGLEKIRDRLGDRWAELTETAEAIVESILKTRLDRHDVFYQYDELHFMIVFADLKGIQAQIKASILAKEIVERFLGPVEFDDYMSLSTVALKEDGKLIEEPILQFDQLVRKFEESQLELIARETDKSDIEWVSMQEERQGLDQEILAFKFFYRPMWYVPREVISGYLCIPAKEIIPSEFITGYDLIPNNADPRAYTTLDLTTLSHVENQLKSLHDRGGAQIFTAPVHFETLASKSARLKFLNACNRISPDLTRYLVFEIVGIDETVPSSRVLELLTMLKSFSRALAVRFDLGFRNFKVLQGVNIHSVGTDLAGKAIDEEVLLGLMNDFCETAEQQDFKTYIHGLTGKSQVSAALSAGFTYINGDIVDDLKTNPEGIRPFDLSNLYKK